MSSLCGPTMDGKADLQRLHHVLGVVDGERRLGDEGQVVGIGRLKPCDIVHGLDQGRRALGQLAHGADDLGMAGMADEDDVAAALVVDLRLAVHLGHQRAGGVDGEEVAGVGRRRHRFGDPVGREDHRSVGFGHLIELADEDCALPLQVFHDIFVVHDLVAHIDRRAMNCERLLDRIDGTDDPGAEAARGTEQDVERRLRHDQAMWRDRAPPVKRERRSFAAGTIPVSIRERVSFPAGAQRRGRESIALSVWVDPLPDLRPPGMTPRRHGRPRT